MPATRRTIGVSDVVVTRQMKRWHAVHTLEIVYRDAFNNQLNDRYQAKLKRISRAFGETRGSTTFQFGIGLVLIPIPQAQTAGVQHRRGNASGDDLLRAGGLGFGERAGGEPSELTTYEAPGEQPAGGERQ